MTPFDVFAIDKIKFMKLHFLFIKLKAKNGNFNAICVLFAGDEKITIFLLQKKINKKTTGKKRKKIKR